MREATQNRQRQVRPGGRSTALGLSQAAPIHDQRAEDDGRHQESLNIGADEKSSRIGYIYELTWRPRGWSYIGATCDFQKRLLAHRSSARRRFECYWGLRAQALLLIERHGDVPIVPTYYYKRNRWTPCPFRPQPPATATLKESLACPAQLANALRFGQVLVPAPDIDMQDFGIVPIVACPRSELKALEAEWIRAKQPQLNDPGASVYHYHYGKSAGQS